MLERRGEAIRFHPTLLAFAGQYRFEPRPVAVARGNNRSCASCVGKTTIARSIAHQTVLAGHTVLFTTAGHMLGELAAQDSALKRRLNHYVRPELLLIDEVGYLSYSNRHADLLFEIVSRRYEAKSTLVTTNRPFAQRGEVFPNAPCVVSLVDRLVHHAEVIAIEGDSYRL